MPTVSIPVREGPDERVFMKAIVRDDEKKILSRGHFTLTYSAYGQGRVRTLLGGGIGSPVENRRGGNVRRLFRYMHERMAEEDGAAVALLHPFSFPFYGQFGYEKVSDHLFLRFPTRTIDFVPRRCLFEPYVTERSADMISIYDEFSRGRNLLLPRFDDRFCFNEKDQRKTYICDLDGKPAAYVVYTAKKDLVVNRHCNGVLTVVELAYTSPEALREIFSFLRMFEGEYDTIEFTCCGVTPEVELMLRHYFDVTYTVVPDLMARVLNTEMMLGANDYPDKEGGFTVRVEDELPLCAGTYRVEFGGGDCRVRRDDTVDPDLTLEAAPLARLLYGYDGVTMDCARYMSGVTLHRPCPDFFRAFPRKPCGIFEHF